MDCNILAVVRRPPWRWIGRIVFEGTPAELRDNEAIRKEWLEV